MPIAASNDECIYAKLVDIVLPLDLGVCKKQRVPTLLEDAVVIEGTSALKFEVGKIYSMFGCSLPISKPDGWHVQAPKHGNHSGFARMLGWDRAHVEASAHVHSQCLDCCSSQMPESSPAPPAQDGANGTRDCQWGAFQKARGLRIQPHNLLSQFAGLLPKRMLVQLLCLALQGFCDLNGKFRAMSLP